MLKIKVNDTFNFEVDGNSLKTLVNGNEVMPDILPVKPNHFHLLNKGKSYRAEVVDFNQQEKTCLIKVNSNLYSLEIKDQFDELLHRLGMDNLNSVKVAELKAPMPGLVLKLLVTEGQEVKKGDNLLVLEAMKMENIIKAPADVKVKSIKIKPSDKVEKNQVMILFE